MGLLNYIHEGFYLNLNALAYDVNTKTVSCLIQVFKDKGDRIPLFSQSFLLFGHIRITVVKSVAAPLTNPPEIGTFDPELVGFLVADNVSEGPFAGMGGHIARWSTARDKWEFWSVIPGQQVRSIDEMKYYELNNDNQWVEIEPAGDEYLWNIYFAKDVVCSDGNNLHKAIYNYLKTKAAFSQCIDA